MDQNVFVTQLLTITRIQKNVNSALKLIVSVQLVIMILLTTKEIVLYVLKEY